MARYDLRLSDEGFYDLTYRQFDALLKQHKSQQKLDCSMIAQLTACVINFSQHGPKQPVNFEDLMPEWLRSKSYREPSKKVRMTKRKREAVADGLRMWARAMAQRNT